MFWKGVEGSCPPLHDLIRYSLELQLREVTACQRRCYERLAKASDMCAGLFVAPHRSAMIACRYSGILAGDWQ